MHKVLILDGKQRSALASTRSLGSKGVPVVVADESAATLAGASKYCNHTFTYPSPYSDSGNFIETVKKEIKQRDIHIIFPMSEVTTYLILKHREEFPGISIPFPDFKAFDMLTDKWRLCELSQNLGVTIPETFFIENPEKVSAIYPDLKFPVVMKPFRSRIPFDQNWIETSVKYANSIVELHHIINQNAYFRNYPFLLQEYIHGTGQGIFTLYNQGNPIAFFAHRRIREKPPSGGVSVLSESLGINPSLKHISRTILDYMKWHGVAMVEFKVTPDGMPYLMEVNARFWGSLQLSIDAGVDFPWLLYQVAAGQKVESITNYKIGMRNRWLLGDLDHLYLSFKNGSSRKLTNILKYRKIIQFLNFFKKNTRYEVNRWDDLKPFFLELKQYIFH